MSFLKIAKYDVFQSPSGIRQWHLNGRLHREDGPAIEWTDGGKEWLIDGRHHREDGPAIELCDGTRRWFLNGSELSEQSFKLQQKQPVVTQNSCHKPSRVVVCAALRVGDQIITGARHFDMIMRSQILARSDALQWGRSEQGFIDQGGSFMNREEAWHVAKEANQIRDDLRLSHIDGTLYSEHLY